MSSKLELAVCLWVLFTSQATSHNRLSKLQRELIDRGIFKSIGGLRRKNLSLHPRVRQVCQTLPLEILRSQAKIHPW